MLPDLGISEADINLAVAMWKRNAPPAYRGLIDGTLYQWDAARRQYLINGNPISRLEIRNRAIEPFITKTKLQMREVSNRLQAGEITVDEWQGEMSALIKYSQLAAALVANGGTVNTNEKDYAAIIVFILAMLLFLAGFADQIRSNTQPMNGLLLSRTDLYASAIRDAYEEMVRYEMEEYTDNKFERRVLDPEANHCTPDERPDGTYWESCPELSEKGWQPLKTLPRLYDTPCRTNCKCHFEYK